MAALDDEAAELVTVDLSEGYKDIGERCVGDPHLFTVEHPFLPIFAQGGRCPGGQGVGSGAGLGKSIGDEQVGFCKLWKVLELLVLAAEVDDRHSADPGLAPVGDRKRSDLPELLHDNHRGDLVQGFSSILLGDFDPQQAQLSTATEERLGDFPVLTFDFFDSRNDFGLDKLPGHVSDQLLLF